VSRADTERCTDHATGAPARRMARLEAHPLRLQDFHDLRTRQAVSQDRGGATRDYWRGNACVPEGLARDRFAICAPTVGPGEDGEAAPNGRNLSTVGAQSAVARIEGPGLWYVVARKAERVG
jgi:hypothetical protein